MDSQSFFANPALEPRGRALQVHLGGSFRRLPVVGNFER